VLGSMGGDAQPQIVLQLLARLLHAGQRPGEVVGSPRFVLANQATKHGFDTWASAPGVDVRVEVEADAPPGWVTGLEQRGQAVHLVPPANHGMGHAHLIDVGAGTDGVLAGSSDPREAQGAALGY
jgi:gamma-glutamyltranspeptidase/glutathione hydrolase